MNGGFTLFFRAIATNPVGTICNQLLLNLRLQTE